MPYVVRLKILGTSIMLKCSCVGLDTSKRRTSSENVRRKGTVSDPIPIAIVTFDISFMTYSGQTTYLLYDITKRSCVERLKELSIPFPKFLLSILGAAFVRNYRYRYLCLA